LIRIGTIWKNGICEDRLSFESYPLCKVDFTQDAKSFVSPFDELQKEVPKYPIKGYDYPLPSERDRNWLLDLQMSDGRNLLVPCLEVLVRLYGRSAEIRHFLVSYRWEEASIKLYTPIEHPILPNTWPVKPNGRLCSGDSVFLAHAQYDDYTNKVVRSINAQVESQFENGAEYCFLKVDPWFQGAARLSVEGIQINDNRTILGLRIMGSTDPDGVDVTRETTRYHKDDRAGFGNDGEDDLEVSFRNVIKIKPHIIELTDSSPPDRSSGVVGLDEDEFQIIGEPRVVLNVQRDMAKLAELKIKYDINSTQFSTGESYGDGKNTGLALLSSQQINEVDGIVDRMWKAMKHLNERIPEIFRSVDTVYFSGDCLRYSPKIQYIPLSPIGKSELNIDPAVRNWLYVPARSKNLRHVTMIRFLVNSTYVYFLEFERRKWMSNSLIPTEVEENLTGLVFTLSDDRMLSQWIQTLLATIRYTKGVLRNKIRRCPGRMHVFNHTSTKDEKFDCEMVIRRAIEEIGLKL